MQFSHANSRSVNLCVRGFDSHEVLETHVSASYRFIQPYVEQLISIHWKISFINKCAKEIFTGVLETQFEYGNCKDIETDFNDLKSFLIQNFKTILCNVQMTANSHLPIVFDVDTLTCQILQEIISRSK